jgi:gliding motility-associated-like protein
LKNHLFFTTKNYLYFMKFTLMNILKVFTVSFLYLSLMISNSYAQGGSTCATAAPFCTGTTYNFDNNINTSAQSGPNYGCLLSQPNPSWYFLQIATSGNIDIGISQTTGANGTGTGIDVDFIMYGPFSSVAAGCSSGLTAGNTVDCSYSAAPTETANITGAVVGQFYLLLLTNYSNQSGYIEFSQIGGSGATNCAIVTGCTATVNNAGPFCAGSTITMSCTPQSGATNYSWTGPNGFSQNGASLTSVSIPGATPAMAGTYTLTITRSPGTPCVLTTAVVVNSVSATFSTPSPTACLTGNSFNFNHTGTAGATHSWNFGGAIANTSTAANPTGVSYAAPGTYVITHVATLSGCTNTQTMSVTVRPMPALNGTPTNAACGTNNGSIVINNTSTGGQGPFSFTNNGTAVGSQTITGLSAGTYTIGITNAFGCTVTTPIVVGNNLGPTDITTSFVNPTCGSSNGSITFGTPTGGTGPYTYSVNGVGATSPMGSLGANTYSISVRDVNGCLYSENVVLASGTGPSAITGNPGAASCGLNNGSYTVTGVTGGTPAYTFSVDGVSTNSVTTGLSSGTHTILVSDAGGCTFNTTFNVAGGVGPTSGTVATTNASCGSANGSATVTGVTGGTLPYTYSYDGGAFAAGTTTAGLSAGNHTVAIRDAGGCTLNVPFTISNTGSPSASITGSTNISCFGGSNGAFTVTPTGGTAPYTYTLATPFSSNGTGQFSGLPQGSYNITIKDAVGCITTTSLTLTQPTAVSITPTGLDALCNGVANGTVNVTGSGGTPTYSYNLNGGAYQTGTGFANVGAATYVMGIRDANGCTATQTVIVNQPSALTINVSTQNANCTAANGVASATVGGGTPIYTYTWTGGGGAAATSNSVVSGNYTVTATDANGCTISSPAVIGNTPGGTAVISASANVTCNGACNGSLTASPVGGVAPFTYSWSPGGQTNATATNLCPGTYTCTITDFYGCKSFASATITQPPVLTAIMNSQNVKCFGTATGTVSAAGSGGTAPYTYLWTSPITNTASTVSNVAIGSYVCNVTDANGCTITQSITVTQPTSVTLTSSVTPANCNQANGSATININGGTPAYTQTWSAGSTSTVQGGVAAGTYTINVHDANNCVQTLAVTIPNLSGPSIAVTSFTNVSCFGGNNGAAVVATSGGASPYIYSWSHGGGAPAATNLTAGTYTVSATDQAGCVASTSVTITEPPVLTVSLVVTQPKCFGATNGGGVASVTGGVNPYTYTWTSTGGNAFNSNPLGAGNYGLTTTDANGCIVTSTMSLVNPPAMAASITSTNVSCFGVCDGIAVASSTNGIAPVDYFWTGGPIGVPSQTLTGACAGTYTVTATDFNNCTAIAQVTITQPTAVTASISATGSVTCNGGNNGFATVSGAGGTGAYTYSWNPGSSTGATSNSLTAGSYVATVKDANQCVATATAVIIEPTPLATTLTTTNPNCNGVCDGTGNVAFGGGAGTTTFQWLPGLQSGNAVNNLCAGSNSVIITSNGACPTTLTFTLTEPALLTAVVSSTNSNCGQANGKTCAVVSGGTAPYNNLWSNGVTTLCNNNVTSGAYTITVTDANNCTATAAGLINDIAGPVVSVASSTNVSCFNGNNGAANSNITGGVTPYTISWSNGQSTANATGFTSGVKTLMVTDAAGCVGTASVQITEPTQFVSAIGSSTNVSCFGLSDGGATLLTNGGTTPYTYNWTPSGATGSVVVNVPAASYSVVATDANGCTSTAQVTITQPQALVLASSSFSNVSCNGGSNGLITTAVQGGVPAYNYSWTPAQTNSGNLNGLSAGAYAVTITDANNCSISSNFNITEPSALTSTYTSLPATCGLANGSATITINGGTPGYSATWNGGTPNPSGTISTSMSPGTNWQATITDSKGCTITQTISIANPPVPAITGFSVTSPSCFGLSNGDITVNYSTGTAPYTITWSNPISQTLTTSALSQSVAGVSAGLYTATLSDSYGCTSSQPVNVTQPSMLTLVPTPNITICYGQSTQISASGQGGTPVYSYTWAPNPFVGGGPHSVNPTVTSQYTVTVSDSKGCSTSPKIITVNVTPQLLVTGTSTTICHNGSTDLIPTITSPGNGGPYTYAWTPTSATTSSINVVGSAPSGSVSNTYTLTVDDGCTIPSGVAVFTVNVNPLPVIDFVGTPTAGCAPLTVTLTGTSDGANDVFTWSDGVNGNLNPSVVTFADSGFYDVSLMVTNPNTGCKSLISKNDYIQVYPKPIAAFYANPDNVSILDPTINFVNTSQGANSYYWNFGDPAAVGATNTSTLTNPSHTYGFTGEYQVNLVATSIQGCKDTAQVMVEVKPDFALYIPNTFTPDGNGVNDIFQPMGVGINEEDYRMDIYDRWGENIFTSNAFRKGWDGTVKGGSKIAEQGVYTYKLMVKDVLGNKHPYVGHVTLLKKDN